jgi:uncharacterized membrane protein
MGYIGLLLNAPYKIDRMMGCVCGYSSYFIFSFAFLLVFIGLYKLRDKMGEKL